MIVSRHVIPGLEKFQSRIPGLKNGSGIGFPRYDQGYCYTLVPARSKVARTDAKIPWRRQGFWRPGANGISVAPLAGTAELPPSFGAPPSGTRGNSP
jgi:hypothetical protein